MGGGGADQNMISDDNVTVSEAEVRGEFRELQMHLLSLKNLRGDTPLHNAFSVDLYTLKSGSQQRARDTLNTEYGASYAPDIGHPWSSHPEKAFSNSGSAAANGTNASNKLNGSASTSASSGYGPGSGTTFSSYAPSLNFSSIGNRFTSFGTSFNGLSFGADCCFKRESDGPGLRSSFSGDDTRLGNSSNLNGNQTVAPPVSQPEEVRRCEPFFNKQYSALINQYVLRHLERRMATVRIMIQTLQKANQNLQIDIASGELVASGGPRGLVTPGVPGGLLNAKSLRNKSGETPWDLYKELLMGVRMNFSDDSEIWRKVGIWGLKEEEIQMNLRRDKDCNLNAGSNGSFSNGSSSNFKESDSIQPGLPNSNGALIDMSHPVPVRIPGAINFETNDLYRLALSRLV